MKQAQNARKQRGRPAPRNGGRNSGGGGAGNNSENRSRGNPKQLLEKYKTQARDSLQAGDRVTAEYYFQFADHYQRVVNESQGGRDQSSNRDQASNREQVNGDDAKDEKQAHRNLGRQERQNRPVSGSVGKTSEKPADLKPEKPQASAGPEDVSNVSHNEGVEPKLRVKSRRPRSAPKAFSDPADAAQPTEIRPELEVAVGVAEQKPKPKPVTRRRRNVAIKPDAAAPAEGPVQGELSVPSNSEPG